MIEIEHLTKRYGEVTAVVDLMEAVRAIVLTDREEDAA